MGHYTVQSLIDDLSKVKARDVLVEVVYPEPSGRAFYAQSGYTVQELENHLKANVEADLFPCACFVDTQKPRHSVMCGLEATRDGRSVYLHVLELPYGDKTENAWWLGLY